MSSQDIRFSHSFDSNVSVNSFPYPSSQTAKNCQSGPLLLESFLMNEKQIQLHLYPHELVVRRDHVETSFPFLHGSTYSITPVIDHQPGRLDFTIGHQKLFFLLQQSFRTQEWQALLSKYLIRQNFHGFFSMAKQIGAGTFSRVYVGQNRSKKQLSAIKIISKYSLQKQPGVAGLEQEIKILRQLSHPSLVAFYGAYESTDAFYLATQYIQGMTLEAFIRKNKVIPARTRRNILKTLLLGLQHLAHLNIAHRDLKSTNVVLSEYGDNVKIIDFGLASNTAEPGFQYKRCGSLGYTAPQILNNPAGHLYYGTQCDMFSLGAIYHDLVYRRSLFPAENIQELYKANLQSNIVLYHHGIFAQGEIQLLEAMLTKDPLYRITPAAALQSPFIMATEETYDSYLTL